MDDRTFPLVLKEAVTELRQLLGRVASEATDLEATERLMRDGVLAVGARLLEAGLAGRGSGKAATLHRCACGEPMRCEGYRPKEVQTLVGWITVRRAYSSCAAGGAGDCPLDDQLGLARDSHSPGVRRLAGRFGALLPFGPAAGTLAEAARVRLSPSTVRGVTEALGERRETEVVAEVARAWADGLAPATVPPPDRLYVAVDGVRILGTDGAGREAKVGVIVPVARTPTGERRAAASYAASFEPAEAFGRRLALAAHQRGSEGARQIAVLGDGAAWIWHLATAHFPEAVQIVDWHHASERGWALGRAIHGEGTAATADWVAGHLARLAAGEAAKRAQEWPALPCRGEAAAVRAEQVTYFTNQAPRMAYAADRAAGWDIGSGMIESACKHLIGVRDKGPGMRWTEAGANPVAQVRVLRFNEDCDDYDLAA